MTDASHKLHKEIIAAKTLRAQLHDLLSGDEQLATDMMEAETNLNEVIDEVVRHLVDDYAALRGLDSMLEDLSKRRERIKHRIDNIRTMIGVALEQAGKKKVEHPAATISIKAVPPSVVVVNEAEIPSKFWKNGEPKLDKKSILEHLKNNEPVPGATTNNGGSTIAVSWR